MQTMLTVEDKTDSAQIDSDKGNEDKPQGTDDWGNSLSFSMLHRVICERNGNLDTDADRRVTRKSASK